MSNFFFTRDLCIIGEISQLTPDNYLRRAFKTFLEKLIFLFNKESFIDSIKPETVKSLIKQLNKKLISAIGFQNVASHLLQCDRHYKSRTHHDRCTRVICRNSKITQIFSQLECMVLKALMVNSYKDFREVCRVFNCLQTFPEFTIDCFIDASKINGKKSSGKKNFGDFNPFEINHPALLFNHLITVACRIAMNILYKKFISTAMFMV